MGREKDPTGDRLKVFERAAEVVLDPTLPIILRLDGRAFHTWTLCLERPVDTRMEATMRDTMRRLALELGARYAYTQSDEITLVCLAEGKSQAPFGSRTQKLCSLMASLASVTFNDALVKHGVVSHKPATFDCRAYNVPDKAAAADVVLWREADAIRNSSNARGQQFFSPKAMHGLSAREVRERLAANGHAWGDLTETRKFGSAIARRMRSTPFAGDELESLPPKHAARMNPALCVERHVYEAVTLPLRWTCANPVEVIFDGAMPVAATKQDDDC